MKLASKNTKVQEGDKFQNNNIRNTTYTMYKLQETLGGRGGGCIKGHHNIISMGRRALVVSIYGGNGNITI